MSHTGSSHEVAEAVLGPAEIGAVARAVEAAEPQLATAHYRVKPDGNLEFDDLNAVEAIRSMRTAVSAGLPASIQEQVGRRSGLGWNVFFGHVVGYWMANRNRVGFLRALADRAHLHAVDLRLHWNKGVPIRPARLPAGSGPLVWGGIAGGVAGLLAIRWQSWNQVLAFLAVGVGLVLGRLVQRLGGPLVCGDRLCRSRIGRRDAACPFCGASVKADAA
jgi:hypothetical protein